MAQAYATRSDVAGPAGTPGGVARELNGLPDTLFSHWLGLTQTMVSPTRFRDRTSYYHALLAAHAISIVVGEYRYGGSEAGPLMAEADGPASRSFATATPTFGDAELSSTQYGRLAMALRKITRGRGSGVVARSGIPRGV